MTHASQSPYPNIIPIGTVLHSLGHSSQSSCLRAVSEWLFSELICDTLTMHDWSHCGPFTLQLIQASKCWLIR